jgi:hypothetical protein
VTSSCRPTDRKANAFGYKGTTTQKGVGPRLVESIRHPQHADRGGPGLPRARKERRGDSERRHRTDASPLLGITPPPMMTGRVIEEGLRGGSAPATRQREEKASSPDGAYTVTAHLTVVGASQYLDYTEVKRR